MVHNDRCAAQCSNLLATRDVQRLLACHGHKLLMVMCQNWNHAGHDEWAEAAHIPDISNTASGWRRAVGCAPGQLDALRCKSAPMPCCFTPHFYHLMHIIERIVAAPSFPLLAGLAGVLVESAGSTVAIAVPDIPACESVIHIVDALLLPQVSRYLLIFSAFGTMHHHRSPHAEHNHLR